jgi:hypothetical protein
MAVIRTERAEVLWAAETTFGSQAGGPYKRFGIHDTIDAPDAEFGWEPFYGVFSGRDRKTILRGPVSFRGSVPDVRILASGGSIDFMTTHVIGTAEAPSLVSPFSLYVSYRDTDNSKQLQRYWTGGKVNRASISAVEGQELRMSVDEMLFLRELNFRGGNDPGGTSPSDNATDPGASTAGRFMFAQGSVQLGSICFARVRRISFTMDNQIESHYYVQRDGTTGLLHPNDLIEGRRVWNADIDLDIVDPSSLSAPATCPGGTTPGDLELWDFLINQGASGAGNSSASQGAQIILKFNQAGFGEGSSVLTITLGGTPTIASPSSVLRSAPHSIPAPPTGTVTTTGSFDVNEVTISLS